MTAISDLSGADVECHHGEPYAIFRLVRNWLKDVCLPTAQGASRIEAAFTQFMAEDYDALKMSGFSDADIETLPISELLSRMRDWVKGLQAQVS